MNARIRAQIIFVFFIAASAVRSADTNVNLSNLSHMQIIKLYKTARENNDDKAWLKLLPFVNQACNFPINIKNLSTNEIYVEAKNESPALLKKAKIEYRPYREINSITEISADEIMAPQGTTVVFWDLDLTLVRQRFLVSNIDPDELKDHINKFTYGALSDEKHQNHTQTQDFLHFIEKDRRFMEMVRMEYANQELMHELHRRGAINVGLTARKKEAVAFTDNSLKNLGIDFIKLSNLEGYDIKFSDEAVLINGVFYTGHSDDKATFIPDLVEGICAELGKQGPFTAWHFDDNEEEIQAFSQIDVDSYQAQNDLIITPVYYRAHDVMLSLLSQNKNFLTEEIIVLFKEFISQRSSSQELYRSLTSS